MQIKQAPSTDFQSQSLSLANQTVDLLDRIDARRRETELDSSKAKALQDVTRHVVRRVRPPVKASPIESFEPSDTAAPLLTVTVSDIGPALEERIRVEKVDVTFNREVEVARNIALRNVEPWRADGELKAAQNGMRAAENGRYSNQDSRTRALENAEKRLKAAQTASDHAGPTKYAQTVRALRDYAVAIEKQITRHCDARISDALAREIVIDLEILLRSVKNLEKGVNGDLSLINIHGSFDPYSRLSKVKEHLEDKISRINSNQDKRLDRLVEQNTVLSALQCQLAEMPENAAIFFFNREGQIIKAPMSKPGNILVGVDRLEYPKSRLRPDGTFLNLAGESVKVEMTYKAIDVPRWKNAGNGPNGAGIDRFAGDDIAGAAIVRPKDGAKPIQANKRVFVEKEVVGIIGDVPVGVTTGMAFKELAKKFGNMEYGKKQAEATEQSN